MNKIFYTLGYILPDDLPTHVFLSTPAPPTHTHTRVRERTYARITIASLVYLIVDYYRVISRDPAVNRPRGLLPILTLAQWIQSPTPHTFGIPETWQELHHLN